VFFSAVLLAVSLSLDAFGVGIAYGLRKVHIPILSKMVICLFSIIYSGMALALGNVLLKILPLPVSKAAGITILAAMGIVIIIQALFKKDSEAGEQKVPACREIASQSRMLLKIAIKSLGITIQVVKNPAKGDIDSSGTIDTGESLLLGFALSVDAIGVGIGSALAGLSSMMIPFAIGFFQLVLLYVGTCLGKKAASSMKMNKKLLSVMPGILLITMAIIRIK
jgi:putative sporulation protein YtaF